MWNLIAVQCRASVLRRRIIFLLKGLAIGIPHLVLKARITLMQEARRQYVIYFRHLDSPYVEGSSFTVFVFRKRKLTKTCFEGVWVDERLMLRKGISISSRLSIQILVSFPSSINIDLAVFLTYNYALVLMLDLRICWRVNNLRNFTTFLRTTFCDPI